MGWNGWSMGWSSDLGGEQAGPGQWPARPRPSLRATPPTRSSITAPRPASLPRRPAPGDAGLIAHAQRLARAWPASAQRSASPIAVRARSAPRPISIVTSLPPTLNPSAVFQGSHAAHFCLPPAPPEPERDTPRPNLRRRRRSYLAGPSVWWASFITVYPAHAEFDGA